MDKLSKLYEEIEQLSDDIPAQLSKKVFLYSKVLQYIGKYHAAAILNYGRAYAERKRIWGEAISKGDGTAKDKEGYAEIASYEARLAEAKAEAEMWKWKNAYTSTQEIINALKVQLKTLMQEYGDAS